MAYRLRDAYTGRLLHVHGIGWFAWDGKRWVEDETRASARAVKAVLKSSWSDAYGDADLQRDVRKCESSAGELGVLALASSLVEFSTSVRDLDPDPWLLNCANGTLDLRTMELLPHDPGDRITKITGAGHRPDADADDEPWTRFLARVLPDPDVRGWLQRLTGVALLGKVVEHVLPIFTGTGANGKTTWHRAVAAALGDYALVGEPDLLMPRAGAHPTGEMDLRGVRLVVVSESDRDRRLAEATVKRLTGGDPIRARRMHRDFVQFDPSHTALLITNHLPKVSSDDPALWRRLRVVPFDVVIPESERDPYLEDALRQDADAILTWAVAGWADWHQRGRLDDPDAVKVATGHYQLAADIIARFIDDRCLVGPQLQVRADDLYEAWQHWAAGDDAPLLSKKNLGIELDNRGYPARKSTGGSRFRQGLALAAEEEQP